MRNPISYALIIGVNTFNNQGTHSIYLQVHLC